MEDSQKDGDMSKEQRQLRQCKFLHTTRSCSFDVTIENLGDDYKDKEPDAVDLFKICHYSKKKKGYTPTVQSIITQMENQLAAPTDDGQPNSATEVVADVLDKNTKNSHFLQNVGVKIRNRRSSLQNVQAQLEVERRTNVELQSIVNNQREAMNDLSNQMQETKQARIKDQEENRKKQAVLEAKLELLLGQNRQS